MAQWSQDSVDVGSTRWGEAYVFGAIVPLNNPNWHGLWDFAEFASWCALPAYGPIFGAGNVTKPSMAEPYSGHWFSDAKKYGTVIFWQDALGVPGAALVRAPALGNIGHVAFAIGDGRHTLEARGKAFGVDVFDKATTRPWSLGCLLPGVDYGESPPPAAVVRRRSPSLPKEFLSLKVPAIKGSAVVALQRALAAKGIDPGPIDGEFGPMTSAAVLSFQLREGLEVDGVVGPSTAGALGLAFPIPVTPQDDGVRAVAVLPPVAGAITLPPPPPSGGTEGGAIDGVVAIEQKGKVFQAKTASGARFIVGSPTRYTDDMNRTGLFQGASAISDSLQFGVYKADDFDGEFGGWAHLIAPTLAAEGNARFATLNTYDRVAFTFGAPQFAAHTPDENFIVYLRELLALLDADQHFPELSLRPGAGGAKTVHLTQGARLLDLEEVVDVVRPNGRREKQLAHLMAYLNPSPTAIDAAELSAAARLMNWLWIDPRAKALQVGVFIGQAKTKLARAKTEVSAFDGKDWRTALWILDILHQVRGTFPRSAPRWPRPVPRSACA